MECLIDRIVEADGEPVAKTGGASADTGDSDPDDEEEVRGVLSLITARVAEATKAVEKVDGAAVGLRPGGSQEVKDKDEDQQPTCPSNETYEGTVVGGTEAGESTQTTSFEGVSSLAASTGAVEDADQQPLAIDPRKDTDCALRDEATGTLDKEPQQRRDNAAEGTLRGEDQPRIGDWTAEHDDEDAKPSGGENGNSTARSPPRAIWLMADPPDPNPDRNEAQQESDDAPLHNRLMAQRSRDGDEESGGGGDDDNSQGQQQRPRSPTSPGSPTARAIARAARWAGLLRR